MSKIKIRFNTQDTDGLFPWRIFIDDEQFLASDIEIETFAQGERSIEDNVVKWNIVCFGDVKWSGSRATVVPSDKV